MTLKPWTSLMKKIPKNKQESIVQPIDPKEYMQAIKRSKQGAPGTDRVDTNIINSLPDKAHTIM